MFPGLGVGEYKVVLFDIEYDDSIEFVLNKSAKIIEAAPTTVEFTVASSTIDVGPTVVNSIAIPTSTPSPKKWCVDVNVCLHVCVCMCVTMFMCACSRT